MCFIHVKHGIIIKQIWELTEVNKRICLIMSKTYDIGIDILEEKYEIEK